MASMFMLSPLAAAIVANIVGGTFGLRDDRAIRRLLIAPGMPGIGDGEDRLVVKFCKELANNAAAAAA